MADKTLKKHSTFNKLTGLAVAATLGLSLFSTNAFAQCRKAENVASPVAAGTAAFYVRKLQSDMMVAALGCGMRNQYNVFATSYQVELESNNVELLSMFRAQHGSQGQSKHTSFLTSMANDASLRMASTSGYCADAKLALDQLTNSHSLALEKIAVSYFSANGVVVGRGGDCPQLTSLPSE